MIPADVQQTKQRFGIIGNAPGLIRAITRALQIAPIDLAVLITGESGAGKEFFPQIIHANSSRKHGKYIAVNCGAIPEGTIDSELFGHEKGAFTGALSARKGYFEEADGGTIFLDEIGDMSLAAQTKVLRVLQENELTRVGSDKTIRVNVRVFAATNKDLKREIEKGNFREDLFHRLNVIPIHVPTLDERKEDIPLLVAYFAEQISAEQGIPTKRFAPEAVAALQERSWTGNIRELRNVVERLIILGGGEISRADVEAYA